LPGERRSATLADDEGRNYQVHGGCHGLNQADLLSGPPLNEVSDE